MRVRIEAKRRWSGTGPISGERRTKKRINYAGKREKEEIKSKSQVTKE